MNGFAKTMGALMMLLAFALWVAAAFFVPAALVKFCWLYLFA